MFEKIKTQSVLKNEEGNLPATTAVLSNNQLGRYIDRRGATILKNVFSATANGQGKSFYQPNEFTVLQDSYAFKFIDNDVKIEKIHIFIVASLNKIFAKYHWANKSGWNKVKEEYITLPTKNGEIDFDFMESFVAELEAERIAELEAERIAELAAYLKVSGLDNYELSVEELNALREYDSINIDEFEYQEIFEKIAQGRRLKKSDQIQGDIPFVMAGVTNTGVASYISNPVASFPKNSITLDIFGNAFYRPYDFGAGDDTGVYWNEEKVYTRESMLFITTAMRKSVLGKYDYGNKLRSSQSKGIKMQLPVNKGKIDHKFMKDIITAIMKLIIKDVVQYTDKRIETTKMIVKDK